MHNRCRYRYRSYHRPCRKTQREINHSRHDKRNPRTNVHFSLFLAKSCRLCAGFCFGSDVTAGRGDVTTRQRRRGGTTAGRTPRRERGRCKPTCRQQKAGHGAAARTPAPQAAAPKPYVQRSGMPSTTAKTVLLPTWSSSPACSAATASPCSLFWIRLAPSTTNVPFEEPRSLTSQPS